LEGDFLAHGAAFKRNVTKQINEANGPLRGKGRRKDGTNGMSDIE
jgi:hypothetical protein